MKIEIDPTNERLVRDAIAAGEADSAEAYINRAISGQGIHDFNTRHRQEIEDILYASLESGFVEVNETSRAEMHAELKRRVAEDS